MTSCPDICLSAFGFHPLAHLLRVRDRPLHQFPGVFIGGQTAALLSSITPFLSSCVALFFWIPTLDCVRLLYRRSCIAAARGRKSAEKWGAERSKVTMNAFPCLALVWEEVIAGSGCTLLDLQDMVSTPAHCDSRCGRENGRKQKRNLDADCRETSRTAGSRRKTEACRTVWRPIYTVTTHFLVSSVSLVKPLLVSLLGKVSKVPSSSHRTVRIYVQTDETYICLCVCLVWISWCFPFHISSLENKHEIKLFQTNKVGGVLPRVQWVRVAFAALKHITNAWKIKMPIINDRKHQFSVSFV